MKTGSRVEVRLTYSRDWPYQQFEVLNGLRGEVKMIRDEWAHIEFDYHERGHWHDKGDRNIAAFTFRITDLQPLETK